MSNTPPAGTDILAALNARYFSGQHWIYYSGGKGQTTYDLVDIDNNDALLDKGPGTDCSHLVMETMLAVGYNVNYLTTTGYLNKQTGNYVLGMTDIINGSLISSSYTAVTNPRANIQVGNVLVFAGKNVVTNASNGVFNEPTTGHTGIVTYYNPITGIGIYSGMQSTNTGLKQNVAFTTNPSIRQQLVQLPMLNANGNPVVDEFGIPVMQTLFLQFGAAGYVDQFMGALQPSSQVYDTADTATAASRLSTINQQINAGLQYAGLAPYYPQTVTPFQAQTPIPNGATTTITSDGTDNGQANATLLVQSTSSPTNSALITSLSAMLSGWKINGSFKISQSSAGSVSMYGSDSTIININPINLNDVGYSGSVSQPTDSNGSYQTAYYDSTGTGHVQSSLIHTVTSTTDSSGIKTSTIVDATYQGNATTYLSNSSNSTLLTETISRQQTCTGTSAPISTVFISKGYSPSNQTNLVPSLTISVNGTDINVPSNTSIQGNGDSLVAPDGNSASPNVIINQDNSGANINFTSPSGSFIFNSPSTGNSSTISVPGFNKQFIVSGSTLNMSDGQVGIDDVNGILLQTLALTPIDSSGFQKITSTTFSSGGSFQADTIIPNGFIVQSIVSNDLYTTNTIGGITTVTMYGSTNLSVLGMAQHIPMNSDGTFTYNGFNFSMPTDPSAGITITAGGQSFNVPEGAYIQGNLENIVAFDGLTSTPTMLLTKDGSGVQFNSAASGGGVTAIGNASVEAGIFSAFLNSDPNGLSALANSCSMPHYVAYGGTVSISVVDNNGTQITFNYQQDTGALVSIVESSNTQEGRSQLVFNGSGANGTSTMLDGTVAQTTAATPTSSTTNRSGISTTTTNGLTNASIAGLGTNLSVNPDGSIPVDGYLFAIPSDPFSNISISTGQGSANAQTFNVPAGSNIQANGQSVIVSKGNPATPTMLINKDGTGVQFNSPASGGGITPIGNTTSATASVLNAYLTATPGGSAAILASVSGTSSSTGPDTTTVASTNSKGVITSLNYQTSTGSLVKICAVRPISNGTVTQQFDACGTATTTTTLANGVVAQTITTTATSSVTVQDGITLTTVNGVTTAAIAGMGTNLPVSTSGVITAGKYTITVPSDPTTSVIIATGQGAAAAQSFSVPAGSIIQGNGESIIITDGLTSAPTMLINQDGSGVQIISSSSGVVATTIGNTSNDANLLNTYLSACPNGISSILASATGTSSVTGPDTTSLASTDSNGVTTSLNYQTSTGALVSIGTSSTSAGGTVVNQYFGNGTTSSYTILPNGNIALTSITTGATTTTLMGGTIVQTITTTATGSITVQDGITLTTINGVTTAAIAGLGTNLPVSSGGVISAGEFTITVPTDLTTDVTIATGQGTANAQTFGVPAGSTMQSNGESIIVANGSTPTMLVNQDGSGLQFNSGVSGVETATAIGNASTAAGFINAYLNVNPNGLPAILSSFSGTTIITPDTTTISSDGNNGVATALSYRTSTGILIAVSNTTPIQGGSICQEFGTLGGDPCVSTITLTPQGVAAKQVIAVGPTVFTWQGGILITTVNGVVTSRVVQGMNTPLTANPDGTYSGGGFNYTLPSDPLAAITVSAGGKTFSIPAGETISSNSEALSVLTVTSGGSVTSTMLLNQDGSGAISNGNGVSPIGNPSVSNGLLCSYLNLNPAALEMLAVSPFNSTVSTASGITSVTVDDINAGITTFDYSASTSALISINAVNLNEINSESLVTGNITSQVNSNVISGNGQAWLQLDNVASNVATCSSISTIAGTNTTTYINNSEVLFTNDSSRNVGGNNNIISLASISPLTVNGNNNSINLKSASSGFIAADIYGNGNSISGSNSTIRVTGTGEILHGTSENFILGTGSSATVTNSGYINDTVTLGTGSSLTCAGIGGIIVNGDSTGTATVMSMSTGYADTLNGNGINGVLNTGANVVVSGTGANIIAGGGNSITVSGGNVQVNGSGVAITGGGNTVTSTNQTVFLTNVGGAANILQGSGNIYNANNTVFSLNASGNGIVGSGNTISVANGVSASVTDNGSLGNIVNLGTGDNLTCGGTGPSTVTANSTDSIAVNITGTYNCVTLNGSNIQNISMASGANLKTVGFGDSITAAGNNSISASNTTVFENGSSATVTGSGNNISATSATLTISGAGSTADIVNGNSLTISGSNNLITLNGSGDMVVGKGNTISENNSTVTLTNSNVVMGNRNTIALTGATMVEVVDGNYNTFTTSNNADSVIENLQDGTNRSVIYKWNTSGVQSETIYSGINGTGKVLTGTYGLAGSDPTVEAALISKVSPVAQICLNQGDVVGAENAQAGLYEAQMASITTPSATPILEGSKWNQPVITWSLDSSMGSQNEATVQQAFANWSAAEPSLTFQEVTDPTQSDINVGLADFNTASTGVAGYTTFATDGNGNMTAGAEVQVEDPTEDPLNNGVYGGTSATLLQTVEHEIGHALGLDSDSDSNSIMYYSLGLNNRSINSTDIIGMNSMYGAGATPPNPTISQGVDLMIQALSTFGAPQGAVETSTFIPAPLLATQNIIGPNLLTT